jgi:hypothetical protein|tara:strand:+ start:38 stop:214 length:177 start_codon:yes stop_codon:yes gene_type:complete
MQILKNTSTGISKNFIIKMILILIIIMGGALLLNKIDFPSPNKEIIKTIPNEKLKIVK